MTGWIDLFVPCEVFKVEVTLLPEENLTPLERMVLQALAEGAVRLFVELDEVFGIGERPMLDLVSDLWRRDLIYLDFEEGGILLPEEIRKKVVDGRFDELDAGDRSQESFWLARDLVLGRAVDSRFCEPVSVTPPGQQIAPEVFSRGEYQKLERGDLEAALERRIRYHSDYLGRKYRIQSVHLSMQHRFAVQRRDHRRFLRLTAHCRYLETSDQLDLAVRDCGWLDGQGRQELASQLTRLAEETVDYPFGHHVFGRAERSREDPEVEVTARASLLEFRQAVAHHLEVGSTSLELANLEGFETLEQSADEVVAAIERQGGASAKTTLVLGREKVASEIESLIGGAEHQLVVVSRDPSLSRWNELAPSLRKALGRQVKIFLFWGDSEGAEVESKFLRELQFRWDSEANFFCALAPSEIASNLLVADQNVALLGLGDFLAKSPDSLALAAKIRPVGDLPSELTISGGGSSGCLALEDLLLALQRRAPDHQFRKELRTFPRSMPSIRKAEEQLVKPVALPGDLPSEGIDTTRDLWSEAWRKLHDEMAELLDRLPDATEIIQGEGRHRILFRRALTEARRRLVVASGAYQVSSLEEEDLMQLRERVASGLETLWLVGKGLGPHERELLDDLEQYDNFRVLQVLGRGQGGLILADDWWLLTSFCFLGQAKIQRRELRQPLFLGVHVATDAGTLDQNVIAPLVKLLGKLEPSRRLERNFLTRSPKRHTSPLSGEDPRVRSRIWQKVYLALIRAEGLQDRSWTRKVVDQLDQWVDFAHRRSSPDVLVQDFETLLAAAKEPSIRLDLTAGFLRWLERHRSETALLRVEEQWKRRFLWMLWNERRFFEALVFRQGLGEAPGLPPAWLIEFTAAPSPSDAWLTASIAYSDHELGGEAMLWLLVEELLFGEDTGGADFFWREHVQGADLPESPLHQLLVAARRFRDAAEQPLRADIVAEDPAKKAKALYKKAVVLFDSHKDRDRSFEVASLIWRHLFSTEHPLGRLWPPLKQGDCDKTLKGLAHTLDRPLKVELKKVQGLNLLRATEQKLLGAGEIKETIHGTKALSLGKQLDKVIKAVDRWARAAKQAQDQEVARVQSAGFELAKRCGELWPELEAQVRRLESDDPITWPLAETLRARLESYQRLTTGGRK